ncbi:MAG: hypothetical protein WD716_10775 [Fimbriimonadaceae bacterium]
MRQRPPDNHACDLAGNGLRNIAFYYAIRQVPELPRGEVWSTVGDNFMRLAILDWCKIFADRKGKLNWRREAPRPETFMNDLLQAIDVSQSDFEIYTTQMRRVRNKWVAHLDPEIYGADPRNKTPYLGLALQSLAYFYDRARNGATTAVLSAEIVASALWEYEKRLAWAQTEFARITRVDMS